MPTTIFYFSFISHVRATFSVGLYSPGAFSVVRDSFNIIYTIITSTCTTQATLTVGQV